jgi:hypothetical protein
VLWLNIGGRCSHQVVRCIYLSFAFLRLRGKYLPPSRKARKGTAKKIRSPAKTTNS